MLIAKIAILFQGFIDDVFQLDGKVGIETDGRSRSPVENRVENQR